MYAIDTLEEHESPRPDLEYLENIRKPGALLEDGRSADEQLAELVNMLDFRKADWPNSNYDVCWLLLAEKFPPEQSRLIIDDIKAKQNPDGTWGNTTSAQSAFVDTLQVLYTLKELGEEIPNADLISQGLKTLIEKGAEYKGQYFVAFEAISSQLFRNLLQAPETRGIMKGLLFTTIMDKNKGLISYLGEIVGKGAWKLSFSRLSKNLFNPRFSMSFSLELINFMDLEEDEVEQLFTKMIMPNGSIGLSPAATAGVIHFVNKRYAGREMPVKVAKALPQLNYYLDQVIKDYNGEKIPNLHPIDTSGELWTLLSPILSGNYKDRMHNPFFRQGLEKIYRRINFMEHGTGWSIYQLLADGDDTSLTLALQEILNIFYAEASRANIRVDVLNRFFQEFDGRFTCYDYEGDPSFGFVLHTIDAMEIAIQSPNPEVREQAQRVLQDAVNQLKNLYVQGFGYSSEQLRYDKWHASRYYTRGWLTTHSVFRAMPETVLEITDKILAEQRENGGFGEFENPTLEETTYVIQSLTSLLTNIETYKEEIEEEPRYAGLLERRGQILETLERSRLYFYTELKEKGIEITDLWISKNLYSGQFQIISAVLDAKAIFEERLPQGLTLDELGILRRNKILTDTTVIADKPFPTALADIMKTTREITGKDAAYFTDGEKFSSLWAIALGIEDGSYRSMNALMIGIDALSEACQDTTDLFEFQQFIDELNLINNLETAHRIVGNYEKTFTIMPVALNVQDSIMYVTAKMIINGREKIQNDSVFASWLDYFSNEFRKHNNDQILSAAITVPETSAGVMNQMTRKLNGKKGKTDQLDYIENALADTQLEGEQLAAAIRAESGDRTVAELMQIYTENVKHTIGLAGILLGSFPGSEQFRNLNPVFLYDLINEYTTALSTASNVIVEPETMNMALFVYAKINNMTIQQAKEKLFAGIPMGTDDPLTLMSHPVISKMQALISQVYAERFKTQFDAKIAGILEAIRVDGQRLVGVEFTEAAVKMASSLSGIMEKMTVDDVSFVLNFLGLDPNELFAFMRIQQSEEN